LKILNLRFIELILEWEDVSVINTDYIYVILIVNLIVKFYVKQVVLN